MIDVYTDGSSLGNPGPSGAAFVAIRNDTLIHTESYPIGHSTNNIAELSAFIFTLIWIRDNAHSDVTIYSDSKYVVDGSTNWIHSWRRKSFKGVKNPELWLEASALLEEVSFDIKWVKAHNGNKWNEVVDELAKKAALSNKAVDNKS